MRAGCVLGGIGWGLMYLSPVTTVMKWFPDRRCLATGLALSALGAGAAIAPAVIQSFIDMYATAPDFIGPLAELSSQLPASECVVLETLRDGTQVVSENSPLGTPGTPVVVATETDIAKLHLGTPGPGAYVLGTGDTGTAKAMASLGVLYGALGMLGSRFMSVPHPDWTPQAPSLDGEKHAMKESDPKELRSPAVSNDIGLPVSYVTSSTSQFLLLWLSVFGNATGGLALLTSSKLMLTDIWTGVAPGIVCAPFCDHLRFSSGYWHGIGSFRMERAF